MRDLLTFLIRLYPASWPPRYEAEFRALLDEIDPTWRTPVDILKGGDCYAIATAHLSLHLPA